MATFFLSFQHRCIEKCLDKAIRLRKKSIYQISFL